MQRKQLGNTGMELTCFGLSGSGFCDMYGPYNEKKCVHFILDCLFRGINYIDTSPSYGQGTSEKIIGLALKGIYREIYIISTKVGRYESDPKKMFDFSAEKTSSSVDASLERLGLNFIDLVLVEDVSFGDLNTILKETLPALQKKVEEGKIKHIGVSDYDLELLKKIVELAEVPIAAVMSYAKSTLIDNRLQDYVGYFKSRGVGVINAAPASMGLLSNAGPQEWHPASAEAKAVCSSAATVCLNRCVELANLATWFCLQQRGITTTVCGFRNIFEFMSVRRVCKDGLSRPEKYVLQNLQLKFYEYSNLNWDNVEVEKYKAELAKIPEE